MLVFFLLDTLKTATTDEQKQGIFFKMRTIFFFFFFFLNFKSRGGETSPNQSTPLIAHLVWLKDYLFDSKYLSFFPSMKYRALTRKWELKPFFLNWEIVSLKTGKSENVNCNIEFSHALFIRSAKALLIDL